MGNNVFTWRGLINLLSITFLENGIVIHQTRDDADTLIVRTTLTKKKLTNTNFPEEPSKVFNSLRSSKNSITNSGNLIFRYINGGSIDIPLHVQRYHTFTRCMAKGIINLERLPPTDEAAIQHSLRQWRAQGGRWGAYAPPQSNFQTKENKYILLSRV